ncbi:MAG TPA: DUF5689 domain-containing protein [Flavipsychrobacter sp.]|nr:DUF5689 domain-containing protein [Flavipsychrobacter sp.]
MKRIFNLPFTAAFIFLLSIPFSCVKQSYTPPPDSSTVDPLIPVNLTIAQLKAKYSGASSAMAIDSGWTIYGIINADDRSGNFYKQINIEDSTGGITVLIDGNSLYAKMPVGRKVYIRLKGLYYGFYNKLPQIGFEADDAGSLSGIPQSLIDNYIVRADYPHSVTSTAFDGLASLKTVNSDMLNRLVTISNVEVIAADTAKTYAQPSTVSSGTSITLEDCSGNKIVIRSSAYSNFQKFSVPKGRGAITALYTVFGSTPQLVIRDTTDLRFYNDRCNGSPGSSTLITIDSLRKRFAGTTLTLSGVKIRGVVVSDRNEKNVNGQNVVVQQGNRGILVRFSSTHSFNAGDSIEVDLAGAELGEYKSLLEAGMVSTATFPPGKATLLGTGTIAPTVVTLATLNGSTFENYESTLVRINGVTISGGGTYSGNKGLTDATESTGAIKLYTLPAAAFAGLTVPGTVVSIVGVVGQFDLTRQISIRSTRDIQ